MLGKTSNTGCSVTVFCFGLKVQIDMILNLYCIWFILKHPDRILTFMVPILNINHHTVDHTVKWLWWRAQSTDQVTI